MKINIKKKLKSAGSTIKEMGSINKKSLKNGSYSMAVTAIVIAILVVVNLIVGQIPEKYTQVDVSTQKLYTISDETVSYLKNLDTDITIYHIVQSGNEDSILEKMLTKYKEESKHITVEKKDPVLYPNFTSQYTSDDVSDNSLIVVAGDKSKVINYSDLYETQVDYTTYQTNTTGFDGEGQIDSAISYVTSENLPVIYTLEGHEELELNSSLTDSLEKANYDVQSLNLLTQDAVPEDTGCLLIAAPQKDLSEEEAQKIITYMEAGGKVMIFTEYTGTDMPNLKSVLENYGVTTGDGVIMEGDTGHYIMQRPYYIVPTIDSSDITSDIKSNRFPYLRCCSIASIFPLYTIDKIRVHNQKIILPIREYSIIFPSMLPFIFMSNTTMISSDNAPIATDNTAIRIFILRAASYPSQHTIAVTVASCIRFMI